MSAVAEQVSLEWAMALARRHRRGLLVGAAAGLLIGTIAAVLQRPVYSSTFSFTSQGEQDLARAGLAGVAGQLGLDLGAMGSSAPPPQLYADLLLTREVLTPIAVDSFAVTGEPGAAKVALSRLLRVPDADSGVVTERTIRKLRMDVIVTTVAAQTTGVVTVQVRTRSPHLSRAIAEGLLAGLGRFNQVIRQSQAREERRFAAERNDSARVELRDAEDSLERFLSQNRELASSRLTLERDRRERDVRLREEVVRTLAELLERARLGEARDTPQLTVLERPNLTSRPDSRLRVAAVVLGLVGGLFVALLLAMRREWPS